MKKISILLILTMIISLIPALSVSAADDAYYLKGLYDGAVVVVQEEPTKTVTLVDSENANGASTGITDVFKVVYTHNDNDPVEVYGSSLSYTMTFTHCGTQTLKYDVYKESGNGVTPDISKTITFNVVAGTKNSASFTEDFERVSQEDLAAAIIANNGQNYNSARLPLTTTDHNGSKALMLDAINKNSAFQLRGAPSATGSKVHYYEFDMATNYSYSHIFYLRDASDYSDSTNQVVLFNSHKDTNLYSGTRLFPDVNTVRRVRVVLDYNETPTATVYFGGVEWKRISLADTLNTYSDITIVPQVNVNGAPIYIDNFSYSVYDVKEPSSFSGASIAGGDKPVLETIPEIRFTGTDYKAGQSLLGKVTLSERANNSDGDFTASDISFTPSIDGTDLVVSFNENERLSLGMTYKVSISGVQDSFLNYYNDYEFIFRTLNEGENPLPEISLTSPVADERYYPNEDTIILSAEAYDTLGGYIEKVEFYADGELIGEGTNTEGNEYKFDWVLDDSINKSEPVAITAKAIDDKGEFSETLPVNIVIWSKQKPEITITAPEEGTIYASSVGGIATGVEPKIKFVAVDYDGTIEAVNVYIDGNPGVSIDPPASDMSYTLPADLSVGEHRITVEVIDNDEQKSYDNVLIRIIAQGKSGYLLNENYKATDLRSMWHVTGTESVNYDEQKGIIIPGGNSAVTAERPIEDNLTETSFAVDIKTVFNNTSAKRVFKLGDIELVTFAADGTYSGSLLNGLTYLTDQTYNVSAVIDAEADKVYALVDGIKVGEASATYTFDPTVIISQEGEGEIAIVSVNASVLAEAKVPEVTFIDEKKFTVDFPAGTDVTTLEGNVSMLNSTGKTVNLSYADGVFTISEVLKTADTYEIVILPDARDIDGNGYSGICRVEYIQPESSAVVAEVSNSGVWTEETSTYDGTLSVAFDGAYENSTEVYLVCAAYTKDHKMVDIFTQAITPLSEPQSYSLSSVDADTVIEAFVIDNFDDLNSISDKILKIK